MKPLLVALGLALAVPAQAQPDYDPVATRLVPTETWTTTHGALALAHAQVTVPGPGAWDVDFDLPDGLTCPPVAHLKRKLHDHGLVAVEAVVQSLGAHEDDGFTKLRLFQWGLGARTYHVVIQYCRP